jgi:hypothetical protein
VGNGRRTAAAHGEQRIAGVEEGGGGGARCSGCAAKEKERNGKGLSRRSSRQLRRSKGREEAPAFAMAVARWHSAGARAGGENGVASAGRPEERRLGRRSSWGRRVEVKSSRRWRGAAGNGGQQRCSTGAEQGRQRKKRGGSEGLVCKNKEVQGPHCKLKFPTDPKG